jgi:L-threonylcarbamoyladenylate synthase
VGTNPEILPTHTPALFATAVKRAAELLRKGQVVALPTETVYGLAANAFDAPAVDHIFKIKGRPSHNPIIVHVSSLAMARECSSAWPALADALARSFWPGPLTLVVPRSEKIPDNVAASGVTVGIRWPSHPFIQAVIRECGFPLAAPSANPSNQLSPTNAKHVAASLGNKVPLIVDGGQSQVGIESTVLDLTVSPPRVLRPGMIHDSALMAVTRELATPGAAGTSRPRPEQAFKSPGQLQKHYSPRAKLVLVSWSNDQELRRSGAGFGVADSKIYVIAHTRIPSQQHFGRVSVIPHDPEAFARALYGELHDCDAAGAELIIIEALPSEPQWSGIADRLARASR